MTPQKFNVCSCHFAFWPECIYGGVYASEVRETGRQNELWQQAIMLVCPPTPAWFASVDASVGWDMPNVLHQHTKRYLAWLCVGNRCLSDVDACCVLMLALGHAQHIVST
jgi:hypothetical protein